MLKLKVPMAASPQPIKDFLRRQSGISLSAWRSLKNHGQLFINEQAGAFNSIVCAGDSIVLIWNEECTISPTAIPLDIRFEDDYLLIINKPPGLLVHPTVKESTYTLANAIMHYFQQQQLSFTFHPVHRLDRNTSGLILIAKLSHIQHLLSSDSIKNLKRYYTAIVSGALHPQAGLISAPIGRHPDSIIERVVRSDGQPAITRYRTIAAYDTASMIELELLTGRTHQIRVHMAHIGHPLLGDDLYGGSLDQLQRQALHAHKLMFIHPITKTAMEITCPLPADMQLLVDKLQTG